MHCLLQQWKSLTAVCIKAGIWCLALTEFENPAGCIKLKQKSRTFQEMHSSLWHYSQELISLD